MSWWVSLLNALAGFASAGFGVVALVKPGLLTPKPSPNAVDRFYSTMYAARAIPLGVAVGIVVWLPPVAAYPLLLLGIAALAQIADVIIGAAHRLPGMIAGAAFAVVCHGIAMFVTVSSTIRP